MTDPIGRLPDETLHQAARDAAAGPPVGGTPSGSSDWPGPKHPSTKYRNGMGGSHPGGIRFRCAGCGHLAEAIHELIQHTISNHRRGPHDTERIPISAAKKT